MESKHLVTFSASAVESPSRERPGGTAKPWDMSCALMYWIVDDEVNDDDDEEDESERGEGIGEGAQWTEFFVAGVAAMQVNVQRARLCLSHLSHNHVLASIQFQFQSPTRPAPSPHLHGPPFPRAAARLRIPTHRCRHILQHAHLTLHKLQILCAQPSL
jgi:hypothetical protein